MVNETVPENRLVFLVEADAPAAQDLARQIGYFGYTVRTFARLTGLKEGVNEAPPAAIIMEMTFSEGKHAGVESLAEIQKARPVPLPVIFISTRDDLGSRLAAVRAGARAYFIKPVDINPLIEQLDLLTAQSVPDPFRVLIVDDSPDVAAYAAKHLEQAGMIAFIVNDPLQVMQPLVEFNPDLILMDLYMPGCTGLELAAVIRQQRDFANIPIVYLSTETDLGKQLEAMRLGGDDFLTQPIEPQHLISSVTSRAQRSRLLRSLMVRDGLTGLLNHTAMKERLEAEVSRARRQNSRLAYAMLDLDHFKSVNDTYGHPTGDLVLKSLARVLQQRLRKSDVIGRYGGEEFAVILPDTDAVNAARVMDGIRTSFAQIRQQSGSAEFSVTFSCGIAACPVCVSAAELNDAADKALYAAKNAGRNRVMLASA